MKYATYALAAATLLALVPGVTADPVTDPTDQPDKEAGCDWFWYTLSPQPNFRVRPECIEVPPGNGD